MPCVALHLSQQQQQAVSAVLCCLCQQVLLVEDSDWSGSSDDGAQSGGRDDEGRQHGHGQEGQELGKPQRVQELTAGRYRLQAVVNHHGSSPSAGHYVAKALVHSTVSAGQVGLHWL